MQITMVTKRQQLQPLHVSEQRGYLTEELITTMGVDLISMETKKLASLLIAAAVLIGVIAVSVVMFSSKNEGIGQKTNQTTVTPTKEVGFVVVRVLPSGFSPKEVEIQKGMIVRFTNPTDTKVLIKWEGNVSYTKALVSEGHDIASSVFEKEGVYTFKSDSDHKGTIIVK